MSATNDAVTKAVETLKELLDSKNPDGIRLEAAREILKYSNFENGFKS